jgi:hypothetical protein
MFRKNVEAPDRVVRRFVWAFGYDRRAFRHTLSPDVEWYSTKKERRATKGIEAAIWDPDQWPATWDEHRL